MKKLLHLEAEIEAREAELALADEAWADRPSLHRPWLYPLAVPAAGWPGRSAYVKHLKEMRKQAAELRKKECVQGLLW
jgi:hypothetical protein